MAAQPSARRVTARPLLFNDPISGKYVEVPAGESCVLVSSFSEACDWGFLDKRNEQASWAAKTNLQRGYKLIWIRGMLRGVTQEDISTGNRIP